MPQRTQEDNAIMTLTIGLYVFNDVEVLDFAGPYEVFTTATRVQARSQTGAPLFRVVLLAQHQGPVRARAGLLVTPDHTLDAHPELDVLIVPGGVVDAELTKPGVINWIDAQMQRVRLTASICTGAFLLAATGRLMGHEVTTHWEDQEALRSSFPDLQVLSGVRWVDTGPIITSAGIAAGIDMSLHLVERLSNPALAERTARQLEVNWAPIPEAPGEPDAQASSPRIIST